MRVFSELQEDILFTSFASPRGDSKPRQVIGLKQIAHLLPERVSEICLWCPACEFAGAQ